MNEYSITRFLFSRFGTMLMGALAVGAVCLAYAIGDVVTTGADTGIIYPSPNLWLAGDPDAAFAASLGCYALIVGGMIWASTRFNFLRSPDKTFAALVLTFVAATPSLVGALTGGTLVAVVVVWCMLLLFSTFANPFMPRRVFLIFLLLSATSLVQYSVIPYVPVFLIGLAQMRIFNLRTFTAALLGFITPLWVLLGLGLADFQSFKWPSFTGIFSVIDLGSAAVLLTTVALIVFLAVAGWVMSFMKVLTYNAPSRAMNGFITLLTLTTPLMMMVDYTNLTAYLPVMCVCAAFQTSHALSASYGQRSYIPLLGVLATFYLLYLWRLAI